MLTLIYIIKQIEEKVYGLSSNAYWNMNAVFQVVNALLTQLDKLKSSPNVIILTTSNITAAIGRLLIKF